MAEPFLKFRTSSLYQKQQQR